MSIDIPFDMPELVGTYMEASQPCLMQATCGDCVNFIGHPGLYINAG